MTAICTAVAEVIRPMFREEMEQIVSKNKVLEEKVAQMTDTICKQQTLIETLSYKLDRSEHYSRRNNVRISGIPDSVNENTDKLVLDLKPSHVDVSHRVPRRSTTVQERSHPIIVRFV